jgi:hypothetical protein
MKPHIDETRFGTITVDGQTLNHDVCITLHGQVKRRKSHLSKSLYGTSHRISLGEVQDLWEDGTTRLLIGAGLFCRVGLSEEAADFLDRHSCSVERYSTRRAIRRWNELDGSVVGLFHITC